MTCPVFQVPSPLPYLLMTPMYMKLSTVLRGQFDMKNYINRVYVWIDTWELYVYASKCQTLRVTMITRGKNPVYLFYEWYIFGLMHQRPRCGYYSGIDMGPTF